MVNVRKIFWWIVGLHVVIWTIVPMFIRYALPHDTIEVVMWGQHFQWGYDKNPWLSAFLGYVGGLGGSSGWLLYLLSQLFVLMALWSIWQLGRKILSPIYALAAVLMMEGCIYYTMVPPRFNDNLIELGLWPLMYFLFYSALKKQKIGYWLGVGATAALAMMDKYFVLVPLCLMAIFVLFNGRARESFKHRGLYLCGVVFVLIVLPHLIWLFSNKFITITYMLNRAGMAEHLLSTRLISPLSFGFAQVINFILPCLLVLLLLSRKSQRVELLAEAQAVTSFDRQFLWMFGLGPLVLTMLMSWVLGWQVIDEWGMPLLSLWGILFLSYFQPVVTKRSFRRFIFGVIVVLVLWPTGNIIGVNRAKSPHSDDYPAKAIAVKATQLWRARYHKPLRYIAGSRYIGGYVAFYSKDKPALLVDWSPAYSPWIDMKKLKHYGALFIQDNYYGTTVTGKQPKGTEEGRKFPLSVRQKYPQLEAVQMIYVSWHRGKGQLPVLIGFLPPEK